MVNADAQDLGIQSRELGSVGLIRWDLITSDRGEGLWEEGEDHIGSSQVAKGYILAQVARQCEVWCLLPYVQFHLRISSIEHDFQNTHDFTLF